MIPERTCRVGRVWCGRVFFCLVVVGYADLYGVCVGDDVKGFGSFRRFVLWALVCSYLSDRGGEGGE